MPIVRLAITWHCRSCERPTQSGVCLSVCHLWHYVTASISVDHPTEYFD